MKYFKVIFAVAGLAILTILLLAVFFEIAGPFGQRQKEFAVARGENVLQIASNLKSQGYIKSKLTFVLRAAASGKWRRLKAGKYDLQGLDQKGIIEKLARGEVRLLEFTVVPGMDINGISRLLSQNGLAGQEDFLALAIEGEGALTDDELREFETKYPFLSDKPEDVGFEGYLFPDTYQIGENASNKDIVARMLDNFEIRMPSELSDKAKEQGKTIFEIITIASMLEREVKSFEDKKIVSGIISKRLKANWPLEIDSTLLYFRSSDHPGLEDKNIDSGYNTYRYAGLPEGPICNPGLESIKAAFEPKESPYWFYLSAPGGQTIFSRDYQEHLINKARYLE